MRSQFSNNKNFNERCARCNTNEVSLQKLRLWNQETRKAFLNVLKEEWQFVSLNPWHGKR